MKKITFVVLCFSLIISLSSCINKQEKDISHSPDSTSADVYNTPSDTQIADNDIIDTPGNNAVDTPAYSEDETEAYTPPGSDGTMLRSEKERVEIQNNLRDIRQLIDDECYEDAMMIIKSLKTRKLSDEENEELTKLQSEMMQISD